MSAQEKIIIVGGGGHAKVLIELIKAQAIYEIAGVIDPQKEVGSEVCGVNVLGGDDIVSDQYVKGIKNACVAVGTVRNNDHKRSDLFENLKKQGFLMPALIHPSSHVSQSAHIAEGVQIMTGVIVQSDSFISENCIVNTGAIIEHDCIVKKDTHIAPGATICGGCEVGKGSFIGAGAIVIQSIRVGKNSLIGAGAVVAKDVPDNFVIKGEYR
ncbi:MAG: acetyltransferase [Candidatus Ancaeobacter aquaticus]|nr:acetyltransferase [Candidatus Ancaeobacter aquaticus]